jgi:hypothetical protein
VDSHAFAAYLPAGSAASAISGQIGPNRAAWLDQFKVGPPADRP